MGIKEQLEDIDRSKDKVLGNPSIEATATVILEFVRQNTQRIGDQETRLEKIENALIQLRASIAHEVALANAPTGVALVAVTQRLESIDKFIKLVQEAMDEREKFRPALRLYIEYLDKQLIEDRKKREAQKRHEAAAKKRSKRIEKMVGSVLTFLIIIPTFIISTSLQRLNSIPTSALVGIYAVGIFLALAVILYIAFFGMPFTQDDEDEDVDRPEESRTRADDETQKLDTST